MRKVAFLLALVIALYGCQKAEQPKGVAVTGQKAPNFILHSLDGRSISLQGLKGRVVLLEFWATWCPPCRQSIPEMEALYNEFRGEDFALVGISMDDPGDKETVKEFIKEFGIKYPVAIDDGKVSKSYGVISIPSLFLLDKEHKIVKHYFGYNPGLKKILSQQIRELLKKNV